MNDERTHVHTISRRALLGAAGLAALSACGSDPAGGRVPSTSHKPDCSSVPCQVAGIYWSHLDGRPLTSVPKAFNLIYLFAASAVQPAGSLAWEDDPRIHDDDEFAEQIETCRSRGQQIMLTAGGARSPMVFSSRDVSQHFVNGVLTINSKLGGTKTTPAFDGLDFNTFERVPRPDTGEYAWMAKELKYHFGSEFAITAPPAPWNNSDKEFCKTLLQEGVLDYVGLQFYDGPGLTNPDYVNLQTQQWVENVAGGNPTKVVVGFGMADQPNFSTLPEVIESWRKVKQVYPNIRGAFLWQSPPTAVYSQVFANSVVPLVVE